MTTEVVEPAGTLEDSGYSGFSVTDGMLTWPVLDATEPLELSAGYVAETVSVGYIGDAVEYTPDE